MHLSVEKGATILKKELISNSTLRRFLWDLDLTGGLGIIVGSGFTGCIQEGPSLQLSLQSAVATEVRWGECPLEDSVHPSCGKLTEFISIYFMAIDTYSFWERLAIFEWRGAELGEFLLIYVS